jgi:hypothetical protein
MAGSSPAMTVIHWQTKDFVIAGLDPIGIRISRVWRK